MATVKLKNVRTGKHEDMTLEALLKIILGKLPQADTINDEVQFKDGEPLEISSLALNLKPE